MHDDTVLAAIDEALRLPSVCSCGRGLTVAVHHGAAWLECPTHAQASRLPALVASFLRVLGHDRRFVVSIPDRPVGVTTRPVVTGHASG